MSQFTIMWSQGLGGVARSKLFIASTLPCWPYTLFPSLLCPASGWLVNNYFYEIGSPRFRARDLKKCPLNKTLEKRPLNKVT